MPIRFLYDIFFHLTLSDCKPGAMNDDSSQKILYAYSHYKSQFEKLVTLFNENLYSQQVYAEKKTH